jgi:hypothetical protein
MAASIWQPSEHLLKKRENMERQKRIEYLTTGKNGYLPLFHERNPAILNDRDLFRVAFTKHPELADRILFKIPESIINDEKFMTEMYHLTKYLGIFGRVYNYELFTRLLSINIAFFDYASHEIYSNKSNMQKCLKTYPELNEAMKLPVHIREEFQMIQESMKIINSIKTFLLCVNQKEISCMRHIICEYLKPTIYNVNKFVRNESHILPNGNVILPLVPIPQRLYEKCTVAHTQCVHCLKVFFQTSHSCSKKQQKVKRLLCRNCPNLEERKEWIQIIRETASKGYGFLVI